MAGLNFLWAVADFTALLMNLFFAFSVQLPLYVRASAVYMPVVQIIILGQFLLYSYKPLTTKLLALLVCLPVTVESLSPVGTEGVHVDPSLPLGTEGSRPFIATSY